MPEERGQFTSPEAEIKALEERLQEKKRELEKQGVPAAEEKEVFREVLKEHIKDTRLPERFSVASPPGISHLPSDDRQKKAQLREEKEKREREVQHLVEVALTRSIEDAVKVAESETPYLLDELHDHLVDDYYDKLVLLRKIKPL